MTYAAAAQARFGYSFLPAWRNGWNAAAAGDAPPPDARHKSEYTRKAEEAGYRDYQEASTGRNWNALGIAWR